MSRGLMAALGIGALLAVGVVSTLFVLGGDDSDSPSALVAASIGTVEGGATVGGDQHTLEDGSERIVLSSLTTSAKSQFAVVLPTADPEAGEGNAGLLQDAQKAELFPSEAAQSRPLKMVLLKHRLGHRLYAHCVGTSNKPRLTVTTHDMKDGSLVWYLGGDLAEKGVKYAMASYVDIHGAIKGKFVPLNHLDRMMKGSELYTGAALDGVPQDINDDEVAAMPDAASATQCTWNRQLAWFASDLHLNGEPFQACSRHILKRQLAAAAELGRGVGGTLRALAGEAFFAALADPPAVGPANSEGS